jgi:hypothetical protein
MSGDRELPRKPKGLAGNRRGNQKPKQKPVNAPEGPQKHAIRATDSFGLTTSTRLPAEKVALGLRGRELLDATGKPASVLVRLLRQAVMAPGVAGIMRALAEQSGDPLDADFELAALDAVEDAIQSIESNVRRRGSAVPDEPADVLREKVRSAAQNVAKGRLDGRPSPEAGAAEPVLMVSLESVLAETATVAFSNIDDYIERLDDGGATVNLRKATREQMAAVAEITIDEIVSGGKDDQERVKRTRIKLHPKLTALRMLGQHFNAWTPPRPGDGDPLGTLRGEAHQNGLRSWIEAVQAISAMPGAHLPVVEDAEVVERIADVAAAPPSMGGSNRTNATTRVADRSRIPGVNTHPTSRPTLGDILPEAFQGLPVNPDPDA